MYVNPKKIFSLPEQPETWIEVDPDAKYVFPDHPLYTKCGWTAFFLIFQCKGKSVKCF